MEFLTRFGEEIRIEFNLAPKAPNEGAELKEVDLRKIFIGWGPNTRICLLRVVVPARVIGFLGHCISSGKLVRKIVKTLLGSLL